MKGALLLAVAVCACSTTSAPTITQGSVRQLDECFVTDDPDVVFLLAVDDSATSDGASVRATIAPMLRPTVERIAMNGALYDPSRADPAAWHPVSIHVVLVFPSASGSARALGPSDDPRLALVAPDSSLALVDAVADAIADDIGARVAPAGAPYLPIDAVTQTVELLDGARGANDAREAALVASVASARNGVVASIVSLRDDEGSDAAAAGAALAKLVAAPFVFVGAIFTASDGGGYGDCTLFDDTTTRLGAWASASGYALMRLEWPCTLSEYGPDVVLPPALVGDGEPNCPPAPIETCALTWAAPSLTACPSAMGLADPIDADGVRRPQTTTVEGAAWRVCEMVALTGADLEACESTLACDNCPAGWCRSPLSVDSEPECPFGGFDLRFIGGASLHGAGALTVTCDED